ncbi:hypothetical protein Cni_G16200 [Canna indica]|uniref:Uncharacterized protein n=1 Tax=Canna indica TaxID=4628 RepID=A0AAQ3KFN6_9LILI|nr:hypothetical protein Cni_G16200 [Canna indica]
MGDAKEAGLASVRKSYSITKFSRSKSIVERDLKIPKSPFHAVGRLPKKKNCFGRINAETGVCESESSCCFMSSTRRKEANLILVADIWRWNEFSKSNSRE